MFPKLITTLTGVAVSKSTGLIVTHKCPLTTYRVPQRPSKYAEPFALRGGRIAVIPALYFVDSKLLNTFFIDECAARGLTLHSKRSLRLPRATPNLNFARFAAVSNATMVTTDRRFRFTNEACDTFILRPWADPVAHAHELAQQLDRHACRLADHAPRSEYPDSRHRQPTYSPPKPTRLHAYYKLIAAAALGLRPEHVDRYVFSWCQMCNDLFAVSRSDASGGDICCTRCGTPAHADLA